MNANAPINLRSLPKVELHRHLEGALRFSTLVELAQKSGKSVAKDLAKQKKQFLVLEPMKDLIAVLNKFLATQEVLATEEILTRVTIEAIEDAVQDGIRILELRYAPTYILNGHPQLTVETIHRAILRGIQQTAHLPIATGLICILQRTVPPKELESILDFVIDTRDTWVGIDLADNEADFPTRNFEKLFARAHQNGLPISIHAGEIPTPDSAQNVLDAIDLLHAQRIGHGLQIIHSPQVLQRVIDQKITLELCPTSNWLTKSVNSIADHPFRRLMEAGVLTTINSDDPGIFGIDLTHEYQALQNHQKFTLNEFDQCNANAVKASFIPLATKQKYWPKPI